MTVCTSSPACSSASMIVFAPDGILNLVHRQLMVFGDERWGFAGAEPFEQDRRRDARADDEGLPEHDVGVDGDVLGVIVLLYLFHVGDRERKEASRHRAIPLDASRETLDDSGEDRLTGFGKALVHAQC